MIRLGLRHPRTTERNILSINNHSNSSIHYQHTNTSLQNNIPHFKYTPNIRIHSLQNNIHVSKVHCRSAFEPGASRLPYYCTSICMRSCCTWRASCVDSKPKKRKEERSVRTELNHICLCVCWGACLQRCMCMSRTHNTYIHSRTHIYTTQHSIMNFSHDSSSTNLRSLKLGQITRTNQLLKI